MIRFAEWTVAAAAMVACTGAFAASHDRLDVQLSAPTAMVQGDTDVTLDVTVTNTAGHAVTVAKWQLPERWTFIAEVPKTSVGKFSKVRMREAYRQGEYAVIEAR